MRALVRGEKPNRRWLIYAHSPLEDRKKVEITIPDYGSIILDVPRAGVFYLLNEQGRKLTDIKAIVH